MKWRDLQLKDTRKSLTDVSTIMGVFLNQKRVNICEHTVKLVPHDSLGSLSWVHIHLLFSDWERHLWLLKPISLASVCFDRRSLHFSEFPIFVLSVLRYFPFPRGQRLNNILKQCQSVMGWQWGKLPWKCTPYVFCYKLIPITYRTSLLQTFSKLCCWNSVSAKVLWILQNRKRKDISLNGEEILGKIVESAAHDNQYISASRKSLSVWRMLISTCWQSVWAFFRLIKASMRLKCIVYHVLNFLMSLQFVQRPFHR